MKNYEIMLQNGMPIYITGQWWEVGDRGTLRLLGNGSVMLLEVAANQWVYVREVQS